MVEAKLVLHSVWLFAAVTKSKRHACMGPKAHEVSQREEREGIRRVCLASVRPMDDPAAEITQILHRTPTALKHSSFCSTDLSFIPQYGNVHVPNCKRELVEHRWHVRVS